MAVETEGTIGKLSFGGYPFGDVNFLSFDADTDDGSTLEINLLSSGGTAFSDLQTVDWGDGSQTGNKAIDTHTYKSASVFTVTFSAQPNFDDVVEAFMFLNRARRLDNGGGAVTALKWDSANNDFQPAPAIAFDVDVNAGNELSLSLTRAASDPTNLGFVDGENGGVTGNSATFTYDNSGVYTAEMVAQPDFGGVDEVVIDGSEDGSSHPSITLSDITAPSWGDLGDVRIFKIQDFDLNGVTIGTTLLSPDEEYIFDGVQNGIHDLSAVPHSQFVRLNGDTSSTGIINDLLIDNAASEDVRLSGISGDPQVVDQMPSQLTRLDPPNLGTDESIVIDLTALPSSFTYFGNCWFGDVAGDSFGSSDASRDITTLFTSGIEVVRQGKGLTGDIGAIPNSLVEARFIGGDFDTGPTDFSNATSLQFFALRQANGSKRSGVSSGVYELDGTEAKALPFLQTSTGSTTKDLQRAVQELYDARATLRSDLILDLVERLSSQLSSLDQEALDQLIGLDAVSDPIEDNVQVVLHGAILDFSDGLDGDVATADDATDEVIVDLSDIPTDGNGRRRISRRVNNYEGVPDTDIESAFPSPNDGSDLFRLKGTGSVDGVYKATGASIDANDHLTISIDPNYSALGTTDNSLTGTLLATYTS